MAVYRFKVKGNGSIGGLKYTEGMNIEVSDTSAGKGQKPINTKVEKLFIQEFAHKYNLKEDFSTISNIKSLFNSDRLEVEEM
jgi:hypothetical protein